MGEGSQLGVLHWIIGVIDTFFLAQSVVIVQTP